MKYMNIQQMKLFSVRGAIQCNKDDSVEIRSAVIQLISQLIEKNTLVENDIVHILFSQTDDLVSENPATALRTLGFENTPLFCSQEPKITSSMPRVIRILISFYANPTHKVIPVYLGGAAELRKDITRP
jgi:chorismate mutase